jgi:hypothetical protein
METILICMKDNLSTVKEKVLEDLSALMEMFMKEYGSKTNLKVLEK